MFGRAMQFAFNKFSFVKTGWTKWINKIFSPIFPAMETLDISIWKSVLRVRELFLQHLGLHLVKTLKKEYR